MEDNFVLQNSGADKKPEFDVEAWLKLASDPSKQKAYEKQTVQKVKPRNGPVETQPIDVDGTLKQKAPAAPVAPAPVVAQPQAPVIQQPPADPIVQTAREVIQEESERTETVREPATDPFAEKPMGMADWLVGLAPLAVDFIQGGNAGTQIAADYYTSKGKATDPKDRIQLAIQKLKLQTAQSKASAANGGKPLTKSNGAWVEDGKGGTRWATYDELNQNPNLKPVSGGDELLENKQIGDYIDPANPEEVIKATHSDALQRGLRPFIKSREVDANTKARINSAEGIAALKRKFEAEKRQAQINNMTFDNQNSLLKSRESDAVTKGTRELAKNFQSLQKAGRRWASDPDSRAVTEQELVVSYLKTLDPGSVARESEQLGVVNAKGVMDMLYTYPERIKLGQKLTGQQVRGILEGSRDRVKEQFKSQDSVDETYKARAQQFGWDISYGLKRPNVQFEDYSYLKDDAAPTKLIPGTKAHDDAFKAWKKKNGYE